MATATRAPTTSAGLRRAAQVFHALSDETRLRILERLRDGERCVCDLTTLLGAAQSRLSFHLKTLKDAGLVTDRRDGRWSYYALNPTALEPIALALASLHEAPSPGARAGDCWKSCC
jgi:ArsR family transcriptional regulator, arsenate/arsenite/antimonite-responsive transcriptional repressor